MMVRITIRVNGKEYTREVDESRTLLHFLREDLSLTGTKEGCGAGECGACTVILDGQAVNSCLILAAETDGSTIETIEGEVKNGKLSRMQEAFHNHHAVQCGFCTPGMIMIIKDLLRRKPKPSRSEIIDCIEGNFCRCTGYEQIIEAVLDVTGQLGKKEGLRYVR
jgi:carbon-monoxide dehydrogenase small subunit